MKSSEFLKRLWFDEGGISSVEYALLLAMVAAGVSIAAAQLGDAVELQMNDAADCVEAVNPAATC
jgi:pilus assembly protein Flp/PilA